MSSLLFSTDQLNQHFKTNISSDAVEDSNLCSGDVEDSKISVDAVQDDAMNEEVINKDVALPFDLAADHYDIMIIYDRENVTERMKAENLKKFLIAKCKPDTKVLLMADPYFEEATDTFDTFGVWKWEMALDKCSLFFLLISAQFSKCLDKFYQTMKSRMNDPNKMWSVFSLHTKNLEYTTPDGLGDVTRIDIKDMIGDEWDITDEKLNVDAIIPPKRRFEKILQLIEKGKTTRKERQEVLENKRKKYKEDVLRERRKRALKEKAQEEKWQREREIKVAKASTKKKQMTKAEPELDDEADADANPSKEEKDKDLTLHSALKRRKIIYEDIGGDMAHEKAASEKTDMTVASATVNDKKAKGVPHSDIGTEPQGDRQDHEFDPEFMEIKVTNTDPDFAERTLANTKVYPVRHNPRGRAVIINNKTFLSNKESERKGSDCDVVNLDILLNQLGFVTKLHQDKTAKEMVAIIAEESIHEDHAKADSFILALFSHGVQGKVCGTDGKTVSVEDIIKKAFDGRHCQALAGKPKLIIIQACRKTDADANPSDANTSKEEKDEDLTLHSALKRLKRRRITDEDIGGDMAHEKAASEKADMIVAYGTVNGFPSFRHAQKGSWFIGKLVEVFSHDAHKEHLTDLLTMVRHEVWTVSEEETKLQGDKKYLQITQSDDTLTKKWYLLPGYTPPQQ